MLPLTGARISAPRIHCVDGGGLMTIDAARADTSELAHPVLEGWARRWNQTMRKYQNH